MRPLIRTSAAALTTLALAAGTVGCGSNDDGGGGATVSASGTAASGHAAHDMSAMGSATPSQAEQRQVASSMEMQRLGEASAGDQKVELDVSEPVTFSVYEGDRLVKHAPRKGENAHMMLLLSDAKSGDRLPD